MVETFPPGEEGKARDKAGERMHVSGRTVDDAAKVIAKAVPEIIEKVRSGEMSVSAGGSLRRFDPHPFPLQDRLRQGDECWDIGLVFIAGLVNALGGIPNQHKQ